MRSLFILFFTFFVGGTSYAKNNPPLTLAAFLAQVNKYHQGLQASREAVIGAEEKSRDGDLLTSPSAFITAQEMVDQKETANPVILGDKTVAKSASVGVSQLTSFGLQAKLSYNLGFTEVTGSSPGFMSTEGAYEVRPTLELNQSLWRNGFGAETKATRDLIEAQSEATRYNEKFKSKMILAEAESIYWRLALAREAVAAQKDSLDRSEKIRRWSARRVKSGLADRVDLLQADAAYQARALELQITEDESRAAERTFNLARGRDASIVSESLSPIDVGLINRLQIPPRQKQREDVKAAQALHRIADANARLNAEKNAPSLDLFASMSLNGRDTALGEARTESFKTEHPTRVVGVRFSTPLNIGLTSRSKSAYLHDKAAAQLNAERRVFEEHREWVDITSKFEEAKKRLQLARLIETAQKKKLDHERNRQSVGRTTTYQVLLFEQDYASAQLARIRTQADVLRLLAQAKTFGGEHDSR